MYLTGLSGIELKHLGFSGTRFGSLFLLASFILFAFASTQASAETRTLKMYYGHSKESATITFKRNGRYIKSGLRKANRFLRDWRRKEPTRMDPALLDLVWEVYQLSGSRKPIQVISGYRSPKTNKALRRRGRKVARNSQHTIGKALDFFMPDVSVHKLRALGLKAHRGGVGYYGGSFVHLDTGKVRHWPAMSRRQLSRVFPRGRTIHVPSNGKPLRGYKVAMANLKKGLNADGRRRRTSVRKSLLARIFTPDGNVNEEKALVVAARQVPKKKPKPKKKTPKPVVVAVKAPAPKPVRAKVKGVDPFSQDSNAVSKAAAKRAKEQQRKLKEAEEKKAKAIVVAQAKAAEEKVEEEKAKAAEELAKKVAAQTQIAALAPAENIRLGIPTRRPAERPSTQLALAPSTLAPRGEVYALRPEVLSAEQATQVVFTAPATSKPAIPKSDIKKLNSRTIALLERQRNLLAAQKASNQKPAKSLTELVAKLTTPTMAPRDSAPKNQVVAALAPENILKEKAPKKILKNVPAGGVIAIKTGSPVQMQSELKLGNLDGRTVKKWAIATSTRVGLSANLTAPVYKRSTSRAAPASVFSGGFASVRFPLRADRFSGRSLTRVAFAHFGQRN